MGLRTNIRTIAGLLRLAIALTVIASMVFMAAGNLVADHCNDDCDENCDSCGCVHCLPLQLMIPPVAHEYVQLDQDLTWLVYSQPVQSVAILADGIDHPPQNS